MLAVTNVSLDKDQTIDFNVAGYQAKSVSGRILTSKNVADYNDFQHPAVVAPKEYKDAKLKKNVLTVKIEYPSTVGDGLLTCGDTLDSHKEKLSHNRAGGNRPFTESAVTSL